MTRSEKDILTLKYTCFPLRFDRRQVVPFISNLQQGINGIQDSTSFELFSKSKAGLKEKGSNSLNKHLQIAS